MAEQQGPNSPFLAKSVVGIDPLRTHSGSFSKDVSTSRNDSKTEKKSDPTKLKNSKASDGSSSSKLRKELLDKNVILLEEVGDDFVENVIWPFVKLSADGNVGKIRLLINSPGGYITEMFQLISMIRNSEKPVIAEVMRAYSAAFMITTQCHERVAYEGSVLMYHCPWTIAFGNSEEIQEQTKYMRQMTKYGEGLVLQRTKIDPEVIKQYRHRDWWMTAREAKKLGVVDRIHEEKDYALSPDYVQERIKVEERVMKKLEK